MKDFRFRAWDKRENKWVDRVGASIAFPYAISPDKPWDPALSLFGFASDSRIEWMEGSGLKNSKGREIFQGDIVHYLRRDTTSFHNDYERTFVIERRDGGFWGKDSGIKVKDIAGENSEVIGNIWENPELQEETI